MVWSAASDNVGVTGYEVWLDDVKIATATGLAYTYTGLACGTDHTVGLVAYDAAGNKTNRALASGPASTTACSTTPSTPSAFDASAFDASAFDASAFDASAFDASAFDASASGSEWLDQPRPVVADGLQRRSGG